MGLSPGRQADAEIFLYYDPWPCKLISAQRTQELQRVRREIPDGYPMGWYHSAIPSAGWAPANVTTVPEVSWERDAPESRLVMVEAPDEIMPSDLIRCPEC